MKRAKRLFDIAVKYVDVNDFYTISISKHYYITMQGELTSEKLKKYIKLGFCFKVDNDTGYVNGILGSDMNRLFPRFVITLT